MPNQTNNRHDARKTVRLIPFAGPTEQSIDNLEPRRQ